MAFKKKEEVEIPVNFFINSYEFTPEEAEKLVMLVALPNFRLFEKYLSRKQNKKAHAMVSSDSAERMLELRAQIRGFGEITGDLKLLWEQIKRKQEAEDTIFKNDADILKGKDEASVSKGTAGNA